MVSPLEKMPDYLVCACMCVMYSEIVEAIENGAKSFDDLSADLLVGTGCNSCVAEIQDILKEKVK
jgi:NAD(P)H-nitrite reductase large subunit